MEKTIVLVGTLDTKESVYIYVKKLIESRGHRTLLVDAGVMEDPSILPDIPRQTVAQAGGSKVDTLVRKADRGTAIEVMSRGIGPEGHGLDSGWEGRIRFY